MSLQFTPPSPLPWKQRSGEELRAPSESPNADLCIVQSANMGCVKQTSQMHISPWDERLLFTSVYCMFCMGGLFP